MSERELQNAHARILDLEQELEAVKADRRQAIKHARLWEKRSKNNHRRLARVRQALEEDT